MKTAILALLLCLLAGSAQAQYQWQQNYHCAFVGVCLPPYNPPITALNAYLGGTDRIMHRTAENGLLYYAEGGRRFSVWVCADRRKSDIHQPLSLTVEQNGVESAPSITAIPGSTANSNDCSQVVQTGTPIPFAQWESPEDKLADFAAGFMNRCLADPGCAPYAAGAMFTDVNEDGWLNGADAEQWNWILNGEGWKVK